MDHLANLMTLQKATHCKLYFISNHLIVEWESAHEALAERERPVNSMPINARVFKTTHSMTMLSNELRGTLQTSSMWLSQYLLAQPPSGRATTSKGWSSLVCKLLFFFRLNVTEIGLANQVSPSHCHALNAYHPHLLYTSSSASSFFLYLFLILLPSPPPPTPLSLPSRLVLWNVLKYHMPVHWSGPVRPAMDWHNPVSEIGFLEPRNHLKGKNLYV